MKTICAVVLVIFFCNSRSYHISSWLDTMVKTRLFTNAAAFSLWSVGALDFNLFHLFLLLYLRLQCWENCACGGGGWCLKGFSVQRSGVKNTSLYVR